MVSEEWAGRGRCEERSRIWRLTGGGREGPRRACMPPHPFNTHAALASEQQHAGWCVSQERCPPPWRARDGAALVLCIPPPLSLSLSSPCPSPPALDLRREAPPQRKAMVCVGVGVVCVRRERERVGAGVCVKRQSDRRRQLRPPLPLSPLSSSLLTAAPPSRNTARASVFLRRTFPSSTSGKI